MSIDSASLQLLVMDLGADFTFVSREERLAVDAPHRWAEEFSLSSVSPEHRLQVRIFQFKISISCRFFDGPIINCGISIHSVDTSTNINIIYCNLTTDKN